MCFRSECGQILVSFDQGMERFDLVLASFAARQTYSGVSGALRAHSAKSKTCMFRQLHSEDD